MLPVTGQTTQHFQSPGASLRNEQRDGLQRLLTGLIPHGTPCRRLALTPDGIRSDGRALRAIASITDRALSTRPIVGVFRADLVLLDLDGCATPGVIDALDRLANEHDAVLAYRAASGSTDSEHRLYAVAESRRADLEAGVLRLRSQWGLDRTSARAGRIVDLDLRTGHSIRLPGSVSLKPGRVWRVQPLDADGVAIDYPTAADMLETALEAVGLPTVPGAPVPSTASIPEPMTPIARPGHVRPLSAHARALIGRPVRAGDDSSLIALRAGYQLWAHGYRSWEQVEPVIMRARAFRKWQRRIGDAPAWWARECVRWSELRPTRRHCDDARVQAWLLRMPELAPDLQASAVACLQVFGDGRGVEDRPIAVRDVVVLRGANSAATAYRRLRALENEGMITVTTEWTPEQREDAACYTLKEPLCDFETPSTQDFVPVPLIEPLHPLWSAIGHNARHCLEHLADAHQPLTLTALAKRAQLGKSALRNGLQRLSEVGLVERRGNEWLLVSASGAALDAASEATDAPVFAASRVAIIEDERALWSADSEAEREKLREEIRERRAILGDDADGRDSWMWGVPGLEVDTELAERYGLKPHPR